MKRLFLVVLCGLLLDFGTVTAQNRRECETCDEMSGYCHRHHHPKYIISNNKVFYDGHELKGASALTFKPLEYGYATDNWNVYFYGKKIDGASSSSFEVLPDGYAKDTWHVYFKGNKIDGASSSSFEVLSDGYAKDTWNTYYWGKKIKD